MPGNASAGTWAGSNQTTTDIARTYGVIVVEDLAITELLEELATREPTAAEREQRALEAARELGIEYTEQVEQAGQDAWAKIRAHQGGAAA